MKNKDGDGVELIDVMEQKLSDRNVQGIVIGFVSVAPDGLVVEVQEFTPEGTGDLVRNFTEGLANLFHEAQRDLLERLGEDGTSESWNSDKQAWN
jgi:hypothetical protein